MANKNYIIFKIIFLTIAFFVYNIITLDAQELKLISFKHLENNTTARINKKTDVNGQNCAVLIIKHSFKDFKVESGKGYEALEEKIGETWVWLSPDEYRLIIRKEGYLPFVYDLKDKLKGLETYELIITDEYGKIKVIAPTASIWLDNKIVGRDSCKIKLKQGEYKIKATKEKFYDEKQSIVLTAGEYKKITLSLKPKTGNLIINSYPVDANIYLDNILNNQKTPANIPLIIGGYNVRIEKDGFLPEKKDVFINENKNFELNFELKKDPKDIFLKHKKKKIIWLISTITATGVGTYSLIHSNNLYKDYQVAGSDAADIRKKIDAFDIITPVTYGIAALCSVEFIIQSSKQHKAKKMISFNAIPTQEGAFLSMLFKF